MVEFVKKTLSEKDCTLDATYSDMYDGTNPYLKVGGITEPKKALLRFQIAEKPTFGDAELVSGELGFYSTDLKLGSSSTYPTFNLYKIKTSPEGRDWGGEGRLRPITRGRQVVSVEDTNTGSYQNSIKVLNHELSTGDRIWWSPVTTRYGDCDIPPLVPETEYYVIKIDRDNFSFAENIEDAIEGASDTTKRINLLTPVATGGRYGYIRSEKYNMDIHVISATPSIEREVVSENFNGSAYRETDLEFEYVQRTVTRRGSPYLEDSTALRDNPNDLTKNTQGSEGRGDWWKIGTAVKEESPSNLESWYGNGESGDDFKILLTSHKTNSDGGGWWRTVEDAGYWGGGHDYVKKGNSAVKFDHETTAGAEPYGDEVTPENCFFHVVKGAAEFQEAAETEEGTNEIQATGAIRLSTKKALTGGQSCNIYQFWKLDGIGISYQPDSNIEGKADRQECMMLYKGLPFPNKNWTKVDKYTHGHGKYPFDNTGDADIPHGSGDMCVSMTLNFEKLEMAYSRLNNVTQPEPPSGGGAGDDFARVSTLSDYTMRRGFHVIFAAVPPAQDDSYYSYVKRLSGYTTNAADGNNQLIDSDTGGAISACGYSIFNTSGGIRISTLDTMRIDTTTKDIYAASVHHSSGVTVDSAARNTPLNTHMEEGEWYTIKTFFPETLNQQAALIVEDSEGEPKQYSSGAYDFWEDNPIPLSNIKSTTSDTKPWHQGTKAHDWYQHMSIWVTNVESAYTTGTVVGGANHPGEDWMASEDDRDTSNNIFIDRIGVTGVNLDHENATVGQEGRSRSKIFIAGNKSYDTAMADSDTVLTFNQTGGPKWSSDKRSSRADNLICLGFEDPSQILSEYRREKSWRYLFWHGYTSANQGADNKIAWTSGNTLPELSNKDPTQGTANKTRWFTPLPDNTSRSTGLLADTLQAHMEHLDAGAPYTYSEDQGKKLKNALVTSYSDNSVTPGAQFSDESLDIRELWRNRTKDSDLKGEKGAKQPMYTTAPSIGAIFDARKVSRGGDVADSTTGSGNLITIEAGPNNGNGVYWNTGQKVIYFDDSGSSLAALSSANGKFTDVPTVYFWERNADTSGFLHATYDNAVAADPSSTRLALTGLDDVEYHVLYDYDYYMNRKYWIDGFSSKGLSRLMLEPVDSTGAVHIRREYLATNQESPVVVNSTDSYKLHDSSSPSTALGSLTASHTDLTKREHVACAAKILEVSGDNVEVSTGLTGSASAYICRVDTTEPLRSTDNTTYRLWFNASSSSTSSIASGLSISIIDEEHIEILDWNGKADDNSTVMTATVNSDGTSNNLSSGLSRLWIGPEKYWISFLIRNQTGDDDSTFANLPLKTYSAVSVCSPFEDTKTSNIRTEYEHGDVAHTYDAWGTTGATYNEFIYNPDKVSNIRGAYVNKWNPSPNLNPNQTIYDLDDFGFGAAKEDKDGLGGENGVIGGYVGKFIPRESQVNRIIMPQVFSAGESKVEGDYLDLAIQQETLSSDAIMTMASSDNGAFPTPFLLTVFEDAVPEAPTDFKVAPYEKDAFYPEFKWSSSDADLWYGFIVIDDTPINNQYHRSILHVPLDEDLSALVSSYDDVRGWYYSPTSNPAIYGYRYHNTNVVPSGLHVGNALISPTSDKILATSATLYDNVEGLAGNTKYFSDENKAEVDIGSHIQFPFSTTSTSSGFTYPVDEMSILVHITPDSWGANRYIAAFNNPDDSSTPSWSIYLDAEGQVNTTVYPTAAATHPAHAITLKSATKVPVDGTPTCIILTVDTQIHSGNVKLYINGRLEDQSGIRGTLSINNWPTDANSMGGDNIFYDTDGTEDLIIGAKSVSSTKANRKSFIGKIEEFVWYDKVIYPVVPQDGTFVLNKPLEELADSSESASSKSHTAKLFVKDYHNIRGKTSGEVAASSQVSFRKAAFELKT